MKYDLLSQVDKHKLSNLAIVNDWQHMLLHNLYGDRLDSGARYGCDISDQRFDDLDRGCISFALDVSDPLSGGSLSTNRRPFGVDIGSGRGRLSFLLAELGIDMTAIDIRDDLKDYFALRSEFLHRKDAVRYLQIDARRLTRDHLPEQFDIVYSQRFIHYLRYREAVALFSLMYDLMHKDGRVFVSASGIDSELARTYEGVNESIENRFGLIGDALSEKHRIFEPVCLYSENDLEMLFDKVGFECVKIGVSTFGNVKGIFRKPN